MNYLRYRQGHLLSHLIRVEVTNRQNHPVGRGLEADHLNGSRGHGRGANTAEHLPDPQVRLDREADLAPEATEVDRGHTTVDRDLVQAPEVTTRAADLVLVAIRATEGGWIVEEVSEEGITTEGPITNRGSKRIRIIAVTTEVVEEVTTEMEGISETTETSVEEVDVETTITITIAGLVVVSVATTEISEIAATTDPAITLGIAADLLAERTRTP